jgi:4-amino-4-deoxy-L-arabinose transferase-like glycosyltransferase
MTLSRLRRQIYVRLSRLRTHHVVLVAVVLRAIWFVLCPNQPVSDQATYHAAASQLAQGRGYIELDGTPANLWPVGYPALLGATYWMFGAHYPIGYLLNIALLLLLVLGTQQLGSALFNREVGLFAALLVALHPTLVLHTTMLTSETPFMVGTLWLLALLVRMARAEVKLTWAVPLAGVSLGVLTYVRPTGQIFVLALPVLGLLWRRVRLAPLALASVGVVVLALLVLLPWGLRNQQLFGVFSLTSNNGGENIWMGNNPNSHGEYMELPADALALPLVERERLLGSRGMAFIRQNPGHYVALCVQRVAYTLRSDTIAAVWNGVGITQRFGARGVLFFKIVCSMAHWILLTLVGYALFTRKQWGASDAALAFVVLLLAAPFVLIVGGNRYMVPIVPLLCIFAASGMWPRVAAASHTPKGQPGRTA